jgi:pantoate--beta-alanine ligase
MIERIGSKGELRAAVASARREGKRVGFVPTMGALHEGHLSLVRAACARTDVVIASVFVNPTQFGPGEDFEAYPRPLEQDLAALAAEGVEIAFTPTVTAMYAADAQVTVDPGALGEPWEGALRPGHFRGVATIVTKLLSIVRPDLAFFGEKDYQQLKIIERLVLDLDLGVGIVACPTVRESGGLALSSRNAYLSPEERAVAIAVPEALEAAAAGLAWGERDVAELEAAMRAAFETRTAGSAVSATLDYAAVVDPETLEPLDVVTGNMRALVAAHVGGTHLIDNCALVPPVA